MSARSHQGSHHGSRAGTRSSRQPMTPDQMLSGVPTSDHPDTGPGTADSALNDAKTGGSFHESSINVDFTEVSNDGGARDVKPYRIMCEQLEKDIKKLDAELEGLRKEEQKRAKQAQRAMALKKEVNALDQQINALTEEMNKLDQHSEELTSTYDKKDNYFKSLYSDVCEKAKAELETAQADLHSYQVQYKSIVDQNNKLKAWQKQGGEWDFNRDYKAFEVSPQMQLAATAYDNKHKKQQLAMQANELELGAEEVGRPSVVGAEAELDLGLDEDHGPTTRKSLTGATPTSGRRATGTESKQRDSTHGQTIMDVDADPLTGMGTGMSVDDIFGTNTGASTEGGATPGFVDVFGGDIKTGEGEDMFGEIGTGTGTGTGVGTGTGTPAYDDVFGTGDPGTGLPTIHTGSDIFGTGTGDIDASTPGFDDVFGAPTTGPGGIFDDIGTGHPTDDPLDAPMTGGDEKPLIEEKRRSRSRSPRR